MKILVIEDEAKTADSVRSGLEAQGYRVDLVRTGDEGFAQLRLQAFDLIILDWMLPGRDGIEILGELRRRGDKTPVLLLTARDAVEDRVLGLDSGADDYLVKPFAFAELLARIRVLLRRAGQEEWVRHQVSDLTLDLRTRLVRRGDDEIGLTPREFDVLLSLMRAEGQVVTRTMLAREIWREMNRSTPLDNVIDVHLARLRRKVDDGRSLRLIHTVRGVGFLCSEKPHPTAEKKAAHE
jgi:two-component system, OmpR family, copper resistance phosphate regulon response regulator CusR